MKTYLDCIPCFFSQALDTARIAGVDEKNQKKILDEIAGKLPDISFDFSPPRMGKNIYNIVRKYSGKDDPLEKIKEKSNNLALSIYSQLESKVFASNNPVLTAVELSIAGNIIDYGVSRQVDVKKEVENILNREVNSMNKGMFHYEEFERKLASSKNILILGDNTGEIVFDKLFIETVKAEYKEKKIIYAVREKPVINDATMKDAEACGLDKVCEVISSGSDAPGTVMSLCSEKFLEVYNNADMVISKGQGNLESLSQEKREIFFLLMAKCKVVASGIGCNVGDIVLVPGSLINI
jgi:damage-control phosphatase, subfamily I